MYERVSARATERTPPEFDLLNLAPRSLFAGVAHANYRVAVAHHVAVVLGGVVPLVECVLGIPGARHVLGHFAFDARVLRSVVG